MSDASLRELQTALSAASDLAGAMAAAPSRQDADRLVATLRRALDVAGTLDRTSAPPGGGTGCALHPNGAVDPLHGDPDDPLPPGYGRCLLCNDRRRRADAHPRPGWRKEVPTRAVWRRTA
ncbi:hypothetical protein ACFV3R_06045 [Streptomyces sp. NPDC059740]|uniref:hypothetical protein n=1 Tax=Streptomyces sp. NPDC059740 TaxID=3346926 RepID=UPI0036616C73